LGFEIEGGCGKVGIEDSEDGAEKEGI